MKSAAGQQRQFDRNDQPAGAQIVIGQDIVREQNAGAFAGGVERMIGAVEAQAAAQIDFRHAGGLEPIAPVRDAMRDFSDSSWISGSFASACAFFTAPYFSSRRGLHTGMNEISTSLSNSSMRSGAGLMPMLRTAISMPSVTKLALVSDDEIRTSTSGCAAPKR